MPSGEGRRGGETRKKTAGPGPGAKKTKKMARKARQAAAKSEVRFNLFKKGLMNREGLELGQIVRLEGDRAAVATMAGEKLPKTLRIMGAIRREFPRKLSDIDPTYVLHNGEEIVAIVPAGEVRGPAPEGFEWSASSSGSAGKKRATAAAVATRKAAHKEAKKTARAERVAAKAAEAAAAGKGVDLFRDERDGSVVLVEVAPPREARVPREEGFGYRLRGATNTVAENRLAAFFDRVKPANENK